MRGEVRIENGRWFSSEEEACREAVWPDNQHLALAGYHFHRIEWERGEAGELGKVRPVAVYRRAPGERRSPVEDLDRAISALDRAVESGIFGLSQTRALRSASSAVAGVRRLAHLPDGGGEGLDWKRLAAGEGRES